MLSTIVKAPRNILTRRTFYVASVVRTEGAAASGKGGFGDKEKAAEAQWARKHDAELLDKLKKSLADQEKATNEIKQKLSELENKK